jgi:hypothetical protein
MPRPAAAGVRALPERAEISASPAALLRWPASARRRSVRWRLPPRFRRTGDPAGVRAATTAGTGSGGSRSAGRSAGFGGDAGAGTGGGRRRVVHGNRDRPEDLGRLVDGGPCRGLLDHGRRECGQDLGRPIETGLEGAGAGAGASPSSSVNLGGIARRISVGRSTNGPGEGGEGAAGGTIGARSSVAPSAPPREAVGKPLRPGSWMISVAPSGRSAESPGADGTSSKGERRAPRAEPPEPGAPRRPRLPEGRPRRRRPRRLLHRERRRGRGLLRTRRLVELPLLGGTLLPFARPARLRPGRGYVGGGRQRPLDLPGRELVVAGAGRRGGCENVEGRPNGRRVRGGSRRRARGPAWGAGTEAPSRRRPGPASQPRPPSARGRGASAAPPRAP